MNYNFKQYDPDENKNNQSKYSIYILEKEKRRLEILAPAAKDVNEISTKIRDLIDTIEYLKEFK